MSFRTNGSQQISMCDRLNNLTDRERRILEKSWAKPFAEKVFPLIDETKFKVLYCNDNGRPNTPVNIVIGSLLLKELTQVTDEELMESVNLDHRYQYALHLTSSHEIPFSDRTVSRFRERLYKHEVETGEDLIHEEIERLSGELAKQLRISGSLKRMDSAMISSSCKKMGRLELIYTCVAKLVKALVKAEGAGVLPDRLLKYMEDGDKNSVCYRLEKDEVQPRLESVTADALLICELAKGIADAMDEYKLLVRMLNDQTDSGKLKPNNQISPRSLQNPSDEDATFRRKAGKGYCGYVTNIVEDCGEGVNIITQYDYDVNVHSDAEYAAETIEQLGRQDEGTVLMTDGSYASDDNFKAAEKSNIELVTTALTGQLPAKATADFQIEDRVIISCPAGHAPLDCEYKEDKDLYRAHFDKVICENCHLRNVCPVIMQKKRALVKLSTLAMVRAQYMKKLSTEEYKMYARKRNGVEGIPSILRRRYGVDHMPDRGLLRSKMCFGFKIGAINVKRVIVAVQNPQSFSFLPRFSMQKLYVSVFADYISPLAYAV